MGDRRRPVIVTLLAVVAMVPACTSESEPVETAAPTTSTTQIILDLEPATGALVSLGEGVAGDRADALTEWAAGLRAAAELVRGLQFLDEPEILFLSADEYLDVWQRRNAPLLDPSMLAVDTRFLQLIGALDAGQSLRVLLEPVFEMAPSAFYDETRRQIVVAAPEEATPDRDVERAVVAAIVSALTDQYHQHGEAVADFRNAGMLDEADALSALSAADAAYFSLVYLQELEAPASVGVELAIPGRGLPAPLASSIAFPFEEALAFVEEIVGAGGIAALDEVYTIERITTELLLHPERYGAVDPIPDVGPSPLALTGYTLHRSGTLGELGLRTLLGQAQDPGLVRQTVTGWGADHFALFTSGNDVAWIYLYAGDSVEDAVELAQAFLDLAEGAMELNEPIASGGGLEYLGRRPGEGEPIPETFTGPYVFVDRVGTGLIVVIADDVEAGRTLVASAEVP